MARKQRGQLLVVHMLKKIAFPISRLHSDAFDRIAKHLLSRGLLEKWALENHDESTFSTFFDTEVRRALSCEDPVLQSFWQHTTTPAFTQSRYEEGFEEINLLGTGGFGAVVKARNKTDGRIYAVKKVRLRGDDGGSSDTGATDDIMSSERVLREATTLSRLQHPHVVRYYQSWVEGGEQHISSWSTSDGDGNGDGDGDGDGDGTEN